MMSSMFSLRKFFRSKLRSSFENEGQHGKDRSGNKSSKVRTVVNEEYRDAFRTKSYTDIRINQGQMGTIRSLDEDAINSPPPPTIHLLEYLVEPSPETLVSISKKHKKILMDYLDVSLEAGIICEFTLQKAHELRVDHEAIRSVIKFIEQKLDCSNQHKGKIYRHLASFAHHTNPFSSMTKEKFLELHDIHQILYKNLTSKCETKKKLMRWMKKALKIVGCGALAIAVLLLAMHGGVAAAAAAVPPGVIVSSCVMKRESKKKEGAGVETQLDVAAKGIYVIINDFETMSRLVQRLHDDMEHRKQEAETCVSKGNKGALKELFKDFKMHERCFLQQLEELEELIYLCFLDINRTRRLLIQQLDK